MVYIEISREKIVPLAIFASLAIMAIGSFMVVDASTHFTDRWGLYLARNRSDFTYWLFYKWHQGEAVYAATSTEHAISVPILLYHGESERVGNTPLGVFVDQMRALKEDGWHTITLDQFRDFMKAGTPVPDKSFLLTFDDGRRDTFYPVDPVLKDLGFTAVMYVIVGSSLPVEGKPPSFYLNKSELQYMLDSGRWEIQSHSDLGHLRYRVQSTTDLSQEARTIDGHFISNKLWNDSAGRFETDDEFAARIRNDLFAARYRLETTFGRPIYSYAFPFNDYGTNTINFPGASAIIQRVVPMVYTFAMYQHYPGNGDSFNYPDPGVFMIRRIEPENNLSGADLVARLNSGRAKILPYDNKEFGQDWVKSWGEMNGGDQMELSATPTTVGASAFLNGSGWWKDYIVEADVIKENGESVEIIARNRDDINYLGCTFGTNTVTIERQTATQQYDLAQAPLNYPYGTAKIGISVKGQSVTCYFDGLPIVSATSAATPVGGIGVEVWDPREGIARSLISNLHVRPL